MSLRNRPRPVSRLVLFSLLVFGIWSGTASAFEIVQTLSGPVRGKEEPGISTFLGIPYAAPPTGALRWSPPVSPAPWTKVRDALKFGPACPQDRSRLPGSPTRMSEDCLTLNIWTPARTETDSLPVMVWIHGGGFISGAGSMSWYNGRDLARRNVVVVSINYRLGVFGFLALPALTAESPVRASGNFGILDQLLALQWVKANIARFGGNPDKVTIFGESAGGVSVATLMASPLSTGLFQRAIVQSGVAPTRLRSRATSEPDFISAESIGVTFAGRLNVKNDTHLLAALRARPWPQVLSAWNQTMKQVGNGRGIPNDYSLNNLIVDGRVLNEPPGLAFEQGRVHNVPFMVGTVADEGSVFSRWSGIKGRAGYRKALTELFGPLSDSIFCLYPAQNDARVTTALQDLIGDLFVGSSRNMALSMSRLQPQTWLYQFQRETSWGRRLHIGVFHGSEIGYLFNTVTKKAAPEDRNLADEMVRYWTEFALTGNPNTLGAYRWLAYDELTDHFLILDVPLSTGEHLRKTTCDAMHRLAGW